jgi:dipeptidyl aminopeptidase/acylaminoacyl peptidase
VEKAAPRVIRDLRYKLDGIGFFDERRLHIFTVDIESGAETQVTDGDSHDEHPAWSPDGGQIAFVSDRERDRHQRQWRTDVWLSAIDGVRPPQARAAGAASPRSRRRRPSPSGPRTGSAAGSARTHLYVIPAEGGGAPRSLSAPIDRPVNGFPVALSGRSFAWHPQGERLLFLAADRGTVALYRADLAGRSVAKVLGGERQIESFALAAGGTRAAFGATWASEPGDIWRPRRRPRAQPEPRGDERAPAVPRRPSGCVGQPMARDRGVRHILRTTGRATYPLALEVSGPLRPPAIVALLSRWRTGVVSAQPSCSSAYGGFTQACVGDWKRDFGDLMAGVDELVRRGIADPDRLYVGGYSYGGFMTAWTVGHTDRFRAAVVGAPVADAMSMFGTGDIPRFSVYEMGSTPFDDPDEYRARSPVTYLSNVKTPVLLLHHEGDLRCPIGQSEEIFQALKLLSREVEFVRYPGGSHGVHTPSQQVDRIKRGLAWYESVPRQAFRQAAQRPTPAFEPRRRVTSQVFSAP